MTLRARAGARVAAALSVPLLLSACAGSDLRSDADAAAAALRDARSVAVTLRVDDPDGALSRALQSGEGGMPQELADLLVGSEVTVQMSATDGRTLADEPAEDASVEEQVRWYDGAMTVRTGDGDLLAGRLVDGELYLSSDLDAVDRVAAAAGEQGGVDEALVGAPPAVVEAVEDLRAGRWLRVPYADLTDGLAGPGELDDGASPTGSGLSDELRAELEAAVEPHVRLTDLGSDGGVRRVTVSVQVKALLQAVLDVVQTSAADGLAGGPFDAGVLETGLLDGLTDAALEGTLTIEDGHYRSLEVPLAGLVALVDGHEGQAPDVGASTLVLELDDDAGAVEVPAEVSDVDLASALGPGLSGSGGAGLPEDLELSPEQEAALACYETADTDAELAACAELG